MATQEAKTIVDWRSPDRKHSEVALRAQPRARPKVLVVDDEPLVRLFVRRVLMASDYEVTEASSAEHAIQLLATERHSFSLLLSDVGLPGVSGPELVEHARRLFPGLPTQLMSATSKHWLVDEGVLASDVDLLQKPFNVGDLLSRIEQLLAS